MTEQEIRAKALEATATAFATASITVGQVLAVSEVFEVYIRDGAQAAEPMLSRMIAVNT